MAVATVEAFTLKAIVASEPEKFAAQQYITFEGAVCKYGMLYDTVHFEVQADGEDDGDGDGEDDGDGDGEDEDDGDGDDEEDGEGEDEEDGEGDDEEDGDGEGEGDDESLGSTTEFLLTRPIELSGKNKDRIKVSTTALTAKKVLKLFIIFIN